MPPGQDRDSPGLGHSGIGVATRPVRDPEEMGRVQASWGSGVRRASRKTGSISMAMWSWGWVTGPAFAASSSAASPACALAGEWGRKTGRWGEK